MCLSTWVTQHAEEGMGAHVIFGVDADRQQLKIEHCAVPQFRLRGEVSPSQ